LDQGSGLQASGLEPGTALAIRPVVTDPNLEIAALLLDLAEVYKPSPRFWGYKNASRCLRPVQRCACGGSDLDGRRRGRARTTCWDIKGPYRELLADR